MKDIMKIVKPLEELGALPEGYSETIEYEAKRWIYSYPIRFFFLFSIRDRKKGILAASVLGNDLAVNDLFDLVKKQLDQAEIFNAASFFN